MNICCRTLQRLVHQRSLRFAALYLPLAFLCFFNPATATEKTTLEVATFLAPPYQEMVDGEPRGRSVDTLECALKRLQWHYKITAYPQKRALRNLETSRVDAILTITPEFYGQINQAGTSDPVALEKWFIYSSVNTPVVDQALSADHFGRLGVVLGSSQEAWLEQRGYPIRGRGVDLAMLLKMFLSQRFDSILVDDFQLSSPEYAQKFHQLQAYRRYFVKYVPKVIAFSHRFLDRNPDFVQKFNGVLSECQPGSTVVDTHERALMIDKLASLHNRLRGTPLITQTLSTRNNDVRFSTATVDYWDSMYREFLAGRKTSADISAVYEGELAHKLKTAEDRTQGLLREIILVDKQGFNLAATDVTSDFYQGDEDKFSKLMAQPEVGYAVSPIRFDASSAQFLVHISIPLRNSEQQLIGAIIYGVNPEVALANQNLWGITEAALLSAHGMF
ncbi:substrate-binding periplasmic protein [Teredinibacter turnerae]|uniref:substrate-binding periplasmic protein n=1 Tax=Teredinibacter turnerae TaxID=2426 RepID=UPI000415DD79|nr:transporter substrate-binding domain-containing protein [Teredinibacter turnerae]